MSGVLLAAILGIAGCDDGRDGEQTLFTRNLANPLYTSTGQAWNFAGVGDPCVIYDGGDSLYKMWLSAGGVVPPDSTVRVRTAYLTSPDGIDWTEWGTNPVFDAGPGGSDWDRGGIETVTVLKDGGTYKMWYGGYEARTDPPLTMKIGLATSTDGITWVREGSNPVLDKGSPGSWEDGWIESPSVVKVGGTYYMLYSGITTGYGYAIGLATSPDGVNWTRHPGNPVFRHEPATAWEDGLVYAPALYHDGSRFIMFYVGVNQETFLDAARIGMATSPDCITWTRSADNPVLGLPAPGSWDEHGPFVPTVLYQDGTFEMWYLSGGNPNEAVGLATYAH
jgi:beta-1,2-mannobiose phosphorylase / 1,2-beta-oligomannan phosphorylase